MKRERLYTALWAMFFGFCISFSAVGGLISAFSMEVSITRLALLCLGASFVGAVCCSLPLHFLPLGGYLLTLGYFWHNGALELSAESLLYRLSRQYNKGYQRKWKRLCRWFCGCWQQPWRCWSATVFAGESRCFPGFW